MMPFVITSGEPAGIGPDICLQIGAGATDYNAVVLGDPDVLSARAQALGLTLNLSVWEPGQSARLGNGHVSLLPISTARPVVPGQLDPANSRYVLSLLDRALTGIEQQHFSAMVTAPVQKSVISDAGIPFSGHTEYLQAWAGVEEVVMMLATPGLKVALVTTHLPLKDVPSAITPERLRRVISILNDNLQHWFGLTQPRILVCGLNPHAGEQGHMGREEIEVIQPVLDQLRKKGMDLSDPLPADTLFTDKVLAKGDAVLAMYHDQGLPVLKYKGFGQAVNITLGLPFVRTSVDHGTALDLAATGRSNPGSLETALRYAHLMVTGTDPDTASPDHRG